MIPTPRPTALVRAAGAASAIAISLIAAVAAAPTASAAEYWGHADDVPLSGTISDMTMTADGTTVLVTYSDVSAVTFYDTATRTTQDVALPATANRVVLTRDGATAYVLTNGIRTLQQVDVATRVVTTDWTLGSGTPTDLAVSIDGSLVAVSMGTDSRVQLIDPSSAARGPSLPTPNRPAQIAISDNSTTAWYTVGSYFRHRMESLDLTTGLVTGVGTPWNGDPGNIDLGLDAKARPGTDELWGLAFEGRDNVIHVGDGSSATIARSFVASVNALSLDFSADGALLYEVAGNAVGVRDIASDTILGTYGGMTDVVAAAGSSDHQTMVVAHGSSLRLYDYFREPGKVTDLVATPADEGMILTWTAPDPGSDPATRYTVEYRQPFTSWTVVSTITSGTSYTFENLDNGNEYSFRVTATSTAGSGPMSDVVSGTPVGPPDRVGSLNADGRPGMVELWWSSPWDDGGTPIIDYRVEYRVTGTTSWTVFDDGVSTDEEADVPGLINQTSYDFRVTAINAVGESEPSTVTATPVGLPGTPVVSATPGDGTVTLSWPAVDAAGGEIYGYLVEQRAPGGLWDYAAAVTHTGAARYSWTATALTNGSTVSFRVTAVSGMGPGDASAEASVVVGVPASSGDDALAFTGAEWDRPTTSAALLVTAGAALLAWRRLAVANARR